MEGVDITAVLAQILTFLGTGSKIGYDPKLA